MNQKESKYSKASIVLLAFYIVIIMPLFIFSIVKFYSEAWKAMRFKEVSLDTFISYAEDKGCKVIDYTDDYENIDYYYLTDASSCPYTMGYIKVTDEKLRGDVYDELAEQTKLYQGRYIYSYIKTNYYKEYVTNGDLYNVVATYGDSVFYLSVPKDYKDDAIKMRKDLGYYMSQNIYTYMVLLDITAILMIIVLLISWWRLNVKLGRKGWICLIPIYNILCLGKDLFGKKIFGLLLLIPFVNIIFVFIFSYKIGKVFNKGKLFKILITVFPLILIPILALEKNNQLDSNTVLE